MVRTQATAEFERAESQFLDSGHFIAAMEEAQSRGDVDVVDMNLQTLQRVIDDLARRKKELDALESRARAIHHRHTGSYHRGRYASSQPETAGRG